MIVGRVNEVEQKRWRIETNSKQDAQLPMSAIDLPGETRRRTTADQLNMRNFFVENDLISV